MHGMSSTSIAQRSQPARLSEGEQRALLSLLADDDYEEAITAGLSEMLADLSAAERRDDGRIEEAARQAVRRVVRAHLGKKPLTDVHIVRI